MVPHKLDWDSQFFNKNIGEVFLQNSGELVFTESDFELIVVKQPNEFLVEIEDYECTFQETKVLFEKKLSVQELGEFGTIKDTDSDPKNWKFFKELAYESGKHSRFLLDPNFGEAPFQNLYNEWIINSINKKFAEKIFYLANNEETIGFVTVQKEGDKGKIGLIATNPKFQGKGFGKVLLQKAEEYCIENGMTTMQIPTQAENIQACQFYQNRGYVIAETLIIKHFWKKIT